MNPLEQIVVTEIKGLMTVFSKQGRWEQMEHRICYGLSFCTEGKITYIQNGNEFVSDPHHAVILPKGQSYIIRGDKTGVFPVINFECKEPLGENVLVFPTNNAAALMKEFEQMKHMALFEKNHPMLMSILYRMFYELSVSAESEGSVLLPAVRYLERNYARPNLNNFELAEQCGLSEVYFRRLFLQHYGTTPKQFLIETRISKAKQLLTDGMLKIHEVAEQCGFSNEYHFCRTFKQKTGVTPSEFANKMRQMIKG